ncbi:MAG: M48 family metallopeptidase [Planctomycetota bacterium]
MRTLLRFVLILSFSVLGSCETFKRLNFYSPEEEAQLGEQAYAEILQSEGKPEIRSGRDYEMVVRVGRKIAEASGANFQWEFKLLDAPDVPNAFCLPGGKIAVYSGILPITQNESGLAAVIGHEVAHATEHHGAIRMSQGVVTQVGLTVAAAGVSMADMSDDQKTGFVALLGAGAQVGLVLPYSREHETDADLVGIRFAIRAGYDPWEAPKLWERMNELGSGGPAWLSTHPNPLDRAEKLRAVIPQILAEESATKQPSR